MGLGSAQQAGPWLSMSCPCGNHGCGRAVTAFCAEPGRKGKPAGPDGRETRLGPTRYAVGGGRMRAGLRAPASGRRESRLGRGGAAWGGAGRGLASDGGGGAGRSAWLLPPPTGRARTLRASLAAARIGPLLPWRRPHSRSTEPSSARRVPTGLRGAAGVWASPARPVSRAPAARHAPARAASLLGFPAPREAGPGLRLRARTGSAVRWRRCGPGWRELPPLSTDPPKRPVQSPAVSGWGPRPCGTPLGRVSRRPLRGGHGPPLPREQPCRTRRKPGNALAVLTTTAGPRPETGRGASVPGPGRASTNF